MEAEPRELNAYRYPQAVQPGCQHMLGCRCVAPYWLRMPSPAELKYWVVPLDSIVGETL